MYQTEVCITTGAEMFDIQAVFNYNDNNLITITKFKELVYE